MHIHDLSFNCVTAITVEQTLAYMKFEAEVVTEQVLPAIRSLMASRLQSEYGLKQQEIAHKLQITQPAVSQYMNGARASEEVKQKIKDDPQIDIILSEATQKAAKGEDYSDDISDAVQTVRDKGLLKEKFRDAEKL